MQAPADVCGVILDMDGTLVDSNDAHAEAWVEAFKVNGYDVGFDRVRPLIGMGGDKILPELIGVEPDSQSGRLVSEQRTAVFGRQHLPRLHPHRGARHLVQLLLDRGHRVAIASSAQADEMHGLLGAADVQDLIGEVVTKDETGRSKPDPDAIAVALERVGCAPAEAIMIGDTPYDVEAARRLGVGTIALRCGGFSDQDLADALAIYDDPQALVDDYENSPLAGRRLTTEGTRK